MFSIGVNNIYPLYLEVLKLKTLSFVDAILSKTNRGSLRSLNTTQPAPVGWMKCACFKVLLRCTKRGHNTLKMRKGSKEINAVHILTNSLPTSNPSTCRHSTLDAGSKELFTYKVSNCSIFSSFNKTLEVIQDIVDKYTQIYAKKLCNQVTTKFKSLITIVVFISRLGTFL